MHFQDVLMQSRVHEHVAVGKVMLQETLTEELRVHRCSAHCKSGLRYRALSILLKSPLSSANSPQSWRENSLLYNIKPNMVSEQKIWTWCGFQLKTAISSNSQLNKGEKKRKRKERYIHRGGVQS